jgi:hypothetical protein
MLFRNHCFVIYECERYNAPPPHRRCRCFWKYRDTTDVRAHPAFTDPKDLLTFQQMTFNCPLSKS